MTAHGRFEKPVKRNSESAYEKFEPTKKADFPR
jgi:hypothetical protein